jgi:hypothetical protein
MANRNHSKEPGIIMMALTRLRPAFINGKIYKPVSPEDPEIRALAKDIAARGLLEALVISSDGVIISGHRRFAACQLLGWKRVPVRRYPIRSTEAHFAATLVSFNQQRVKTPAEHIREQIVQMDPANAHNELLAEQVAVRARAYQRVEQTGLRILDPDAAPLRHHISAEKWPMLEAAQAVLQQYQDYWPLTLRQVHYRLLTRKVLRNTLKPDSLYVNTTTCYKDLSQLLTRARLSGLVPWQALHDPTRPHESWRRWPHAGAYLREQLEEFLGGYYRDLLQSQPAYVELVVEKITVQDIAERAAVAYQCPVGVGRGFTSQSSLHDTAERFRASGKDHFILLIAGDLDPAGEDIVASWTASLRDEHDIRGDITAVKVAVNADQVNTFCLAPMPVKEGSTKGQQSKVERFREEHGDSVYELEAFEPDVLQRELRAAIGLVLDLKRFRQEQERQSREARQLLAVRDQLRPLLLNIDLDADADAADEGDH